MVRLKKLQRQRAPKLRKATGQSRSGGGRRCTMLNCLACACLILNVLVLSLSLLINRRIKDDALPPPEAAAPNKAAAENAAQPALKGTASNQDAAKATAAPVPKATAAPAPNKPTQYHTVFSSDCKDPTQDWQAYVFFFHAAKSKQPGDVTHIITGCDRDHRKTRLQELHDNSFAPMGKITPDSPTRFHLYFAPPHPQQASVGHLRTHMRFFNKPYGVQQWMEEKLGYSSAGGSNSNDDLVVLMMDTDMILLRSFEEPFSTAHELWKKPQGGNAQDSPTRVLTGQPLAHYNPYPTNWWQDLTFTSDSAEINNGINMLKQMDIRELDNHYSVGAPYLSTAKDFYPLVQKWNELTYPLYQVLNEKALREPHAAHTLAAAILKKPHQLSETFAVSNYRDLGFGLFGQAYNKDAPGGAGGTGALCRKFPKEMTPHVLKYSKRYSLGNFIIGKHYVQQNFVGKPESCQAPLFAEPPDNVAEMFTYYKDPELGTHVEIDTEQHVHTMTFMVCEIIQAFNEAATHYKRENCQGEQNLQKTLTF